MSMEHLELDADYGALSFDYYILVGSSIHPVSTNRDSHRQDHWKEDSPENGQQQWERLVWEYQRLSLKERYV